MNDDDGDDDDVGWWLRWVSGDSDETSRSFGSTTCWKNWGWSRHGLQPCLSRTQVTEVQQWLFQQQEPVRMLLVSALARAMLPGGRDVDVDVVAVVAVAVAVAGWLVG